MRTTPSSNAASRRPWWKATPVTWLSPSTTLTWVSVSRSRRPDLAAGLAGGEERARRIERDHHDELARIDRQRAGGAAGDVDQEGGRRGDGGLARRRGRGGGLARRRGRGGGLGRWPGRALRAVLGSISTAPPDRSASLARPHPPQRPDRQRASPLSCCMDRSDRTAGSPCAARKTRRGPS